MLKNSLITFGCSWMFGWNINDPTKKLPSDEEIARQAPIADALSFRALISKSMGSVNINHSIPGSSNECQFRLANESFLKIKSFENMLSGSENVAVLWSITDLYRTEYWSSKRNKYKNIVFSSPAADDYAKFYINDVFDPDQKALELAYQIRHWQIIFQKFGIKDYWIDLFNNNNYRDIVDLDRFIFPRSNLFSEMASAVAGSRVNDSEYYVNHTHSTVSSKRQQILIEQGLINPLTCHPTEQGHQMIAGMMLDEITRIS